MADAVKEVTGVGLHGLYRRGDNDAAVALAKSVGVDMDGVDKTWGNAAGYETFDQKVEETLIQPTFITDVSRRGQLRSPSASPSDPHLTERYEMLHVRLRDGQRLHRAERPDRPE